MGGIILGSDLLLRFQCIVDDKHRLRVGSYVPGGDTATVARGHGHLSLCEGRIFVARARKGPIHVQERGCIGILGFDGDGGSQHAVIDHVVDTLPCAVIARHVPEDRGADIFVAACFLAIVTQFFTLIDERLAGRGEEHGRGLLLPD